MKDLKFNFDSIVCSICDKIPFLGKPISKYYLEHLWFRRFAKFSVSTFLVYWLVRAPMMVLFTDILGIWYVMSTFIVGIILSLVGFLISEGWIWK